jgi:hypothetical protein
MITLDVADLVVIAEQTVGTGGTALRQLDAAAAQAALAEGRPAGDHPRAAFSDQSAAAAAGIGLMHALLRHPPFPHDREPLAVAAVL